MPNAKTVTVFILGAAVGLLFGVLAATPGFMFLRTQGTGKSVFFSACTDRHTLLDKSVPGNEVVLKNKLPGGSSERVDGRRSYRSSAMSCDVSADRRGIDQFMRALQSEMQNLAHQTGANIDDGFSTSMKSGAEDEYITHFEIQYSAGNAHGKVTADLGQGSVQAGTPTGEEYHLSVRIDEWVH
jgi:hypothetical protein